jgi:PhnB protein
MAVGDMPYGDTQGGARDTDGNIWWISQRLVEAPCSA